MSTRVGGIVSRVFGAFEDVLVTLTLLDEQESLVDGVLTKSWVATTTTITGLMDRAGADVVQQYRDVVVTHTLDVAGPKQANARDRLGKDGRIFEVVEASNPLETSDWTRYVLREQAP